MLRVYIDYVLVITKNCFEDHLKSLDRVLQRRTETGLKLNAEKSFLRRTEMEYFSFWVSNNGVRLISSKVETIKEINIPAKVRDVRRFVGLMNYYRDIWRKRANTLAPLTKLCSMKVKLKWTDVENNDFIATKKIVGRDVLLSYPNFI